MMKQRTLKIKRIGVILLLGLLLAGCMGPESQALSFETIDEGMGAFPTGRGPEKDEPDLLIITAAEEVDAPGLGVQFPSDLAEQLGAVDYDHDFVIVVFREVLGGASPKDTVEIRQVIRQRDKVIVQAHFGEPGLEEGILHALSRPYRIIAVSKEGQWGQEIRFVLRVDGRVIRERTHFIP